MTGHSDLARRAGACRLLQHHGPAALRSALAARPLLADLAVDVRLQWGQDHLQWAEGRRPATRDAAQLIATFPP